MTLTSSLDDITWENYQDIVDALTKFTEITIDAEISKQASIYSYYYGLMSYAKREHSNLEADLVRLTSSLRKGYKAETTAKLTAKDLDDLVFSSSEYISTIKDVNNAEFKYNMLKGLVRALEHKKDMLQQASANKRKETGLYQ
jgi:hypothetical protein